MSSEQPSFLGIDRSVTGRRWVSTAIDERLALAHAQTHGLPDLVGRLLAARGIAVEGADSFLRPTLREEMPDPSVLKDMDRAAVRLADAIERGEPTAVFGDYDVDGATSSALLIRYFRAVGRPLTLYVPDRIGEGYGPNLPALLELRRQGVSLVVTVDCGITAFDVLDGAGGAGLDVLVVDHHKAEARLPRAVAVVDPNRLDEPARGPLTTLAAVGVTFLLLVAVNRELRRRGRFAAGAEPDLMGLLDLVALGTVCDVVPLVGLNRALVAQGLKVMARRGNAGLAALADIAGLTERPDAFHLGYILVPRVNAGGRVGRADLGARLLASEDPEEIVTLARALHALNAERREIEKAVVDDIVAGFHPDADSALVFAVGEGWHPGVIGIVAARLKERFERPACVVALDGEVGKGSGRSVRGIDLGAAVIAARQEGLLLAGGGHAMAAGFTVARSSLGDLQAFLSQRLATQLAASGPVVPTLHIDAAVSARAAAPETLARIEALGPFGTGNPEPRFAVAGVRIVRADVVGTEHVRCVLTGPDGGRLKAIAFRSLGSELGPALLRSAGRPMHLAGQLRPDRWNGTEGTQLMVDDAAFAAV